MKWKQTKKIAFFLSWFFLTAFAPTNSVKNQKQNSTVIKTNEFDERIENKENDFIPENCANDWNLLLTCYACTQLYYIDG